MDDGRLRSALARDLDAAFEQLVLSYQDRLYRFGMRLTGSPQDGEEIAQDAFVRAYEALGRYPSDRIQSLQLRAWLYQIAVNVFRNRVRRRKVQQVPLDAALQAKDGGRLPEQMVEDAESRNQLAALITALPERYRMAIVLRHVEDLDYAELSAILDQPVGTVKANVHRGLRMVRAALKENREEVGNER